MSDSLTDEKLDIGIARFTLPGETESGDLEIIRPIPRGFLLGVVDGLGHGLEAARAARAAVEAIGRGSSTSVVEIARNCHMELKRTRGVVMGLAAVNMEDNTMTWLSVGNVEGIVLRASSTGIPGSHGLLLRRGVLGYVLPELTASTITLDRGDLLIFTTDGIRNDFAGTMSVAEHPAQKIAEHLCTHHVKGTDDALVLVARYGRAHP